MCSVERYHHLCRAHSPTSARASVVCLATIFHRIRGILCTVPELSSLSLVMIMKINRLRELLQNLADLVDFHKRGLCVDSIVVSARGCSEATIPLSHLVSLLVEQYADIDPGTGCSVVSVGLCVCPQT